MLTVSALKEQAAMIAKDFSNPARPYTEAEFANKIVNTFVKEVETTLEEMDRSQTAREAAAGKAAAVSEQNAGLTARNEQLEAAFVNLRREIENVIPKSDVALA